MAQHARASPKHPYLLGTHAKLNDAAAPTVSLTALIVAFGAAALVVAPSLILLYLLQQQDRMHSS